VAIAFLVGSGIFYVGKSIDSPVQYAASSVLRIKLERGERVDQNTDPKHPAQS
jgi:hypothetical protein